MPRIAIEAVLDVDTSAFEISVDIDSADADLTELAPEAAAEVQNFAADVASSYASSVGSSLGVGAGQVAVSCLFRNADATKLDLLTLTEVCGMSSRRMMVEVYVYHGPRRLQATGFGVEMELVGAEVVTSVTDSTAEGGGDTGMSMQEMLAAQVATADVVIESSLLPEGVTVGAEVTGISVAVTTQAPTQSPTPRPTSTALRCH